MPTLALVIPAYRRYEVSAIAFPQLAWACVELWRRYGIDAFGVVVADDNNLDIARASNLYVLERPNSPLGRKWNDGYEWAVREGADYLVPCGSDDWIDPAYLAQLPAQGQVRASRRSAAVREDGRKLVTLTIPYEGGDGVRIMPAAMFADVGYRPCGENRERAIDTSIWRGLLRRGIRPEWVYSDDPLAIVQFQSHGNQLNTYEALRASFGDAEHDNPWKVLGTRYQPGFVKRAKRMFEARMAAA